MREHGFTMGPLV